MLICLDDIEVIFNDIELGTEFAELGAWSEAASLFTEPVQFPLNNKNFSMDNSEKDR